VPNVLLSVPHFEQSRDGACLPACVRMVLAYWDQSLSEAEVAKILGAKAYGTPISNVLRLDRQGFQVDLAPLTPDQLKDILLVNRPVIARVWTPMLEYWPHEDTSHVVVVVGFDETYVYLNDPALSKPAQATVWDSFLAAWAEFDETGIVIYPA
jgi:ABC-type bacteriocin/lantibiotic exporter with double-glycine peptidase domain